MSVEREGNVTKEMTMKNLLPEVYQKEASLFPLTDPILPYYLDQPTHQVGP